VELAQLKYLLPRLTGQGASLSRLGGGIGTRGPGETKLETESPNWSAIWSAYAGAAPSIAASATPSRSPRSRLLAIPTPGSRRFSTG